MKIRKEVKIGVFGLLMIALLIWGINFLKGRDFFSTSRTYYAYYEDVDGVQLTTPVIVRGIPVGSVTKITFRPEMNNMVEVQFGIKKEYKIPQNSVARVASNGIIGGKAVFLQLGDSPDYLENGAVLTAESEAGLLDGLDIGGLQLKLDELINNINSVAGSIGSALGENGNLKGTLDNIESISAELDRTVKAKADSLALVIDNLTAFSNMLAGSSDRIDNAITNIDEFSGSLAQADVKGMVEKLNEAVDNINNAITSPEGSLGLLVNDSALYDSLAAASANLASLLEDIEQNPGRYVHISVFGRKNK